MWAADEIREIFFLFCSPPRPVKRFKCNKDFSCLAVMSPFLFHPPIFDGIPLLFSSSSPKLQELVYILYPLVYTLYLQTIFNLFLSSPPFFLGGGGLILPALRFSLDKLMILFSLA